jgi:hypothetical protein
MYRRRAFAALLPYENIMIGSSYFTAIVSQIQSQPRKGQQTKGTIMQTRTNRAIAVAAAAGLALAAVGLTSTSASAATRRHNGDAAAAIGAFAVMAGTIAAIAAANNDYDSYGPAPYYAGRAPYYGYGYGYRPAWRGHVQNHRWHR